MKIEIMENSGFCFGVRRAIDIAKEAARKYNKVVTLGPIIHNPQMVEKLQEKGLGFVSCIEEIDDRYIDAVVIRSHGITLDDYKRLVEKDIDVVDATCPIVQKAQKYAQKLTKKGYQLVLLGDKNHPEVEALLSYVDDSCIVVGNIDRDININCNKIALIAQTTQSENKFEKLAQKLISLTDELRIFRTICNATKLRQEKTAELAQKADLMLVVGGKNSANTTRLAEISQEQDCDTHHLEIADEIDHNWLENRNLIGISAGASTPDWIIDSVKNKILKYIDNEDNEQLM